jgi:hypothetical protein
MTTPPPVNYNLLNLKPLKPTHDIAPCDLCRGMGYTLPAPFIKPEHSIEGIPGVALYRYGLACRCPNGAVFAREQEKWNEPILPRSALAQPSDKVPTKNPATWEPPAWSDPPVPKPKQARAPRVTQQEINEILEQQKINRKGEAPQ